MARITYMYGYSDDAIVSNGVLAEGVECMAKPVSPAALARRVREVMDEG